MVTTMIYVSTFGGILFQKSVTSLGTTSCRHEHYIFPYTYLRTTFGHHSSYIIQGVSEVCEVFSIRILTVKPQ